MREKKQVVRELSQAANALRDIRKKEGATADEIRNATYLVEKLTDELNVINVQDAAERAAAQAQMDSNNPELRAVAKRFSMAKFIRELSGENGISLTGVEAEVASMGAEEAARNSVKLEGAAIPVQILNARAFGGINAETQADGGYMIQSELQYQEGLRSRLVLAQAGANYVGGLVGNITLVDGVGVSVSWENENDAVGDTKKQFSTRNATPKRCAVSLPVSKQLALQSSFDVDNLIMNDIYAAHAEALETAAINGTGTKQPTGLINTSGIAVVEMGANGGVPSWKNIVDLETQISLKNGDLGRMGYLMNPKIRGLFKTTLKSAGVPGFVWENNEINGYPAFSSNVVPSNLTKGSSSQKCSAIVFGDWSNLWIMSWGGLDLVVDPYTMKKQGAYEVTLNAYHDIFVRRKESFAIIKDALEA